MTATGPRRSIGGPPLPTYGDWPPLTPRQWPPPPSHRGAPGGDGGGTRSLFQRVGWAGIAEIVNLVGTALLFLVLAAALEPDGYGSLQAVVSIAVIAGPLATFGANWQLIRRTVVSTDPTVEAGRAISVALVGTVTIMAVLIAASVAVPGALPGISRLTIALVLVAQMPAYWLAELAATSAVAQGDLRLAAQLRVVTIVIRLLALGAFLAIGAPDLDTWAWLFAIGNLAAAMAALGMLARSLGAAPQWIRPARSEFTTGFPYGVGNTTEGFLAASDRPLLKQNGFDAATGFYAAGYRVVTLGFIPLMALLRAQDQRFFRQGADGSEASHRAARSMSLHALVATVPVAIALWLAAPLFGLVIGSEWTETADVIRILAVLPVIKGFQFSFGNALTAAGNQTSRMWLTGAAAAGNLLGNLRYIPSGSWRAAAATTLVAEIGLAIGFAAASFYYARTRAGAAR